MPIIHRGERTLGPRAAEDLISVLIPNHNYGRFLPEAIDSVVAQDYGAVELIVIDDGSADDSVAVAERHLAAVDTLERAELVALGGNRGKLAALNSVASRIRGRYLMTLDADDWLAPNYIRRCVDTLRWQRQAEPTLGFVYTDCHLVSSSGKSIDRGRSAPFDRELVGKLSFLPEPAVMLAEVFTEAMPFDESIRVATKHHKWCRVVANGWSGFHIPEPLFFYRMHDENMSGIGRRVLEESNRGLRGERILSGYWQLNGKSPVSS